MEWHEETIQAFIDVQTAMVKCAAPGLAISVSVSRAFKGISGRRVKWSLQYKLRCPILHNLQVIHYVSVALVSPPKIRVNKKCRTTLL